MILNANALHIPLADGTAQTCVTSPPYYGLRDYGVPGQIGLEETPEQYVEKLVQVFREVKRVLRDDGTLWVNLGDSYAANGTKQTGRNDENPKDLQRRFETYGTGRPKASIGRDDRTKIDISHNCKPKDLIGIPWLVAFALRADGWYLRSEIIWHKTNPMPESVTDRPTKSHEQIFLLSKSAKYYYDAEAIKEPSTYPDDDRKSRSNTDQKRMPTDDIAGVRPGSATYPTRNKRDVWTVSTKPYPEAHFATYPPDLIEPCILAGTSERGQCPECGAPWARVVEKETTTDVGRIEEARNIGQQQRKSLPSALRDASGSGWRSANNATTGWQPTCTCDAGEPVPQIVLDPFSGSGTTGAVAIQYRRRYVGLELNREYINLSRERTTVDVMLPMFI